MGRHRRRGLTPPRRWPLSVLVGAVLLVGGGTAGAVVAVNRADSQQGCAAPATIEVGTDPATRRWLDDLAGQYNRAAHRVDGRCVRVTMTDMDARRAAAALQSTPSPAGGQPPDVWVPQSTALLDLVRARPGSAAVLPDRAPSVASSPLVLAAPPDAIRSLHLDRGSPTTLADLLRLAVDPAGWGALGHPEWGPLRFSLVDPSDSVTGTSLLVGLAGASAGVGPAEVTPATFATPAAKASLFGFVRAVALRAASSSQLVDRISSSDSAGAAIRSLGLIALSEQDVWTYDADAPAIPLQAVYPFGGGLAADYPFVVPTGRWVSGFDQRAAADFRSWLGGARARGELARFGLRPPDGSGTGLTADGQGIDGRTFAPTPAAHPDAVVTARGSWRLLTQRVLTLAAIDVSGSMGATVQGTNATKLQLAAQAARNALRYYADTDDVGLWEFSTGLAGGADYRELVSLGPASGLVDGVPRRQALDQAYRSLVPRNGTALYDTVLAAYTAAQQAYRPDFVNTVVVLTDGTNEDPDSISLDTLLADLTAAQNPVKPVHIVTIAFGDKANTAVLDRIARATGGLSFAAPDPRDIGAVFLTALTSLTR